MIIITSLLIVFLILIVVILFKICKATKIDKIEINFFKINKK